MRFQKLPLRLALAAAVLFLGGRAAPARSESLPDAAPHGGAIVTLSPEMARLAFLIGNWSGAVTPAPAAPAGLAPAALETRQAAWLLNGSYVRIESQFGSAGEPPQSALMLLGYDPEAKRYRLRSFLPGGRMEALSGSFEGARLVLTNADESRTPRSITGIGLVLDPQPTPEGYLLVHGTRPGAPADRAGLKGGDVVTRIDGHSVVGTPAGQSTDLIRGPAGTRVRLTVRRGGQERAITLARAAISLPPEPMRLILAPGSDGEFTQVLEAAKDGRFERLGVIRFQPAR
jgi:hypothetical protein